MFRNPFEMAFLVGSVFYWFVIYGRSARGYRHRRSEHLRSRPLDIVLDFATFTAWLLLPILAIFTPWLDAANYTLPVWAGWLGVGLLALALIVLWRAYSDLGRNWSPKIELMDAQKLVTTGIYGVIRHPIYAGLWLWAFAQPLLIQNWIAGPAMLLVFALLYVIRMPREEQMMVEAFGDDYRRYMERTGRVLPRLP
jgi:protein-S-isoprenylcysteine O-methyltransferase Ste14